jgi:CHASE2 domain-containing sensor protein
LHVQAINNLNKAGARVIGLDILFSETTAGDEVLARQWQNQAICAAVVGTAPKPSDNRMITYTQTVAPAGPLAEAASNTGHSNLLMDPDGKVRRLPLVIQDSSGRTYPAFSLAVLQSLFSQPLTQGYFKQEGKIHILDREIPVDSTYAYRINFASDNAQRPYISYKDVISGDFDPGMVENKIVLVGMVATGELDKWDVPSSSSKSPGYLFSYSSGQHPEAAVCC